MKIAGMLREKKISLLTANDLRKLLWIRKDNTLYKLIERLIYQGVLLRVSKGLFQFAFSQASDYQKANTLYHPSYISLETALNHYGILDQVPYAITSMTVRKTRNVVAEDREFDYVHLSAKYFWGFRKEKDFLIALPEKALIDELYTMAKGIRHLDWAALDLTRIKKDDVRKMAGKISYKPLQNLMRRLKI